MPTVVAPLIPVVRKPPTRSGSRSRVTTRRAADAIARPELRTSFLTCGRQNRQSRCTDVGGCRTGPLTPLPQAGIATRKRHAESSTRCLQCSVVEFTAPPWRRIDRPATIARVPACMPIALLTRWPHDCDRSCCSSSCSGLRHPSSSSAPAVDGLAVLERPRGSNPHVKLASYNQGGGPSLKGGVGWINSGPITPRRAARQDRPARFLDVLLHQLPPHPARPGQARREVQERAGRHRRPHRQVRRRARHREHPPQGRRVPDQAPGRQRRQHGDLERFGVKSWPTLVLIDANGQYVGRAQRRGTLRRRSTG